MGFAKRFQMKAPDILEDYEEVYEKYRIPPNLRMHMLRVAAVSNFLVSNWQGPDIDKNRVVAVSLIHDLGNIAKMDFSDEKNLKLLGEEAKNAEHWRKVKEEITEEYGSDDHVATMNMAKELGVPERMLELLEGKEFGVEDETARCDDWERKLCTYSDRRVAPHGVVSLEERFREAEKRYANNASEITVNNNSVFFMFSKDNISVYKIFLKRA